MITYQVERWPDCVAELRELWLAHWAEVAMNKDTIKLDPWEAAYVELDRLEQLVIVTVRRAGELVGYHISIVRMHLHYQATLHAFTDVYYLKPEERQGMAGVRLFSEVERALRARGVQKMFTGTKLSLDMGRIFERLGWTETERLYTKYIGS
jgi:L-amino acid N-acyltransferase YncA